MLMIFSSCLLASEQLEVMVEDIAGWMAVDAYDPGHGVRSDEKRLADEEMSRQTETQDTKSNDDKAEGRIDVK